MKPFAALLDALIFMPSRNGKLRLMTEYFATTPDPDRGYALAALTGDLSFRTAKPALLRQLVADRVDPELFALSYDFVGDLAETAALIWPQRPTNRDWPHLAEVVEGLNGAGRTEVPTLLAGWLDSLDATGRWALLKLITGGLRVGVSARLAKTAVATIGGQDVAEVEEVWHGLTLPYEPLFAWVEGREDRPNVAAGAGFRPLMLANPLEERDADSLDIALYRAEWKWDGIRVQMAAKGGERRIYSRTGDDISGAFPDLLEAMAFDAVVDGELLVLRESEVAPFNDLQQRLNRKSVTAKMLRDYPAHVRLYDLLFEEGEDLRPLSFDARRLRLEQWHARTSPLRTDLSPLIPVTDMDALRQMRSGARDQSIEGLMLKRADSPYLAGRPKGPWFKWKRDPLTLDVVLMYAQRGHGKRSSFYSDYTFGVWREEAAGGSALVPVGKAYSGFTDEELLRIDKWVRAHTTNRFGPVREVEPGLVFEVAFDSAHPSPRHKSGYALRFPRIHRIRWDKPIEEADGIEAVRGLLAV
ncbi:MAG: cisplatin damage response ATP-dependent DNA ligase [Alphaproteobacteria bacterium]|nr:cisplatin damage response ATP-dependent DNA ligase [Alphaproteobacteria bacterium]MBU0797892.1 cisplatin damage response ATP-dependent DNA ligase [Alphaproteobacteria bacterium]